MTNLGSCQIQVGSDSIQAIPDHYKLSEKGAGIEKAVRQDP
jgi:hypothetical protein